MRSKVQEWTIERWKTMPRLNALEWREPVVTTPLWQDLAVAAIVAAALCGAALVAFR